MNEKIKELAQQADMEIDYFGYGYCTDGGNPDVEKFAELIVRECASVVDSITSDTGCGVANAWCESKDILDHFGIRE